MSTTEEHALRAKCSVADGKFVEPCSTLAENTDMISTTERGRGIFSITYTNMKTFEQSRSMFGIKSRAHPRGGFLFNFCPFCGEDISAPFQEKEEAA